MEGVLIVVLGPSTLDFKNQRNWGRFPQYLHNQSRCGKTDRSIGFSASNRSNYLEDVLIVVGGLSSLDLKISEIGHVSIYISTTRAATAKRMAAFDLAHQICISTSLEGVLIVVGGLSSLD